MPVYAALQKARFISAVLRENKGFADIGYQYFGFIVFTPS